MDKRIMCVGCKTDMLESKMAYVSPKGNHKCYNCLYPKGRMKKKKITKLERFENDVYISKWNKENKVHFEIKTKCLSALEQFNHYCDNTN